MFITISKLFGGKDIDTFVIMWAILLAIKRSIVSAVFWIAPFEVVLNASIADCLVW